MRRRCQSGGLRQLVTIRQPATPSDGETKPTWSDLVTSVPCEIKHGGGRESVTGDRVLPLADKQLRLRYRSDVNTGMRVIVSTTGGTETLELIDVGDPDGMRRWLHCKANKLDST